MVMRTALCLVIAAILARPADAAGGGPLLSPTTNTFDQAFERGAGDAIQMAGNPPALLQRCLD